MERKRTLAAAAEEFQRRRELDGSSDAYLRNLRSYHSQLCRHFGGATLLVDIGRDELEHYLDRMDVSAHTRKNHRKVMVSLWQFAVERGYVADNPAKQIKAPVVIADEPGTLTPAEMIRLLNMADGDLLAYVAISGFAGLRRAEIERLDWSDVDLDAREIDVKAHIAKSKKRRIVAIADNLYQWLASVHQGNGAVVGRNLASNLPRITKAAKIEPWLQNCLRHSFASYHLAHHENAASTAFLMGHRDSNLVYSTYARAVRKADAEKWWSLAPAADKSVVAMP